MNCLVVRLLAADKKSNFQPDFQGKLIYDIFVLQVQILNLCLNLFSSYEQAN